MNYSLLKEYLKKLTSDELSVRDLLVYLLLVFWFIIPLVALTLALVVLMIVGVQLEFINNQLMSLPWDKLPVSDDARLLITNFTLAVVFAIVLIVEMKVVGQIEKVIKKKFQKTAEGGGYEK